VFALTKLRENALITVSVTAPRDFAHVSQDTLDVLAVVQFAPTIALVMVLAAPTKTLHTTGLLPRHCSSSGLTQTTTKLNASEKITLQHMTMHGTQACTKGANVTQGTVVLTAR